MFGNLRGPSRLLAVCATILLISSAMLGLEAVIMIALGPARGIVFKPFLLLGYLEGCAMFFSLLGVIAGIIGVLFYRPYRFISDKIYLYRTRRAVHRQTYFENMRPAAAAHIHNPDEDGIPD